MRKRTFSLFCIAQHFLRTELVHVLNINNLLKHVFIWVCVISTNAQFSISKHLIHPCIFVEINLVTYLSFSNLCSMFKNHLIAIMSYSCFHSWLN